MGAPAAPRALAFALALLCIAVHCGAADVCDGSCQESEAPSDSSLLQTLARGQRQAQAVAGEKSFPDLDSMRKAAEQASGVLDDVAVNGLTSVAGTLDRTLGAVLDKVQGFYAEVNASSGDVTKGAAALLAKELGLNISATTGHYEDSVEAALTGLAGLWSSATAACKEVLPLVHDSLKAVGQEELAKTLDTDTQMLVVEADKFSATLQKVQADLLSNGTLALAGLRANMWSGAVVDQLAVPLIGAQTRVSAHDAVAFLADLNMTLQVATQQAAAFAVSFSRSITTLRSGVVEGARGVLGPDALVKVQDAFDAVQATAEAIAEQLAGTVATVLGSVSSGAGSLGVQAHERGAAGRVRRATVVVTALAAALFATA